MTRAVTFGPWRTVARIRCLVLGCRWTARGQAEILGQTLRHYATAHTAAERTTAQIIPGTIRRPPVRIGTA